MNYAASSEKIKEIDRKAMEEWGIPSSVLMENAGRSTVDVLEEEFALLPEKTLVICGKGNNGGDGLVVARRLIDRGIAVDTFVLGEKSQLSEETERNANLLELITDRVTYCKPGDELLLDAVRANPPLIVDAIFGIGIEGELRGSYPELVTEINDSRGKIVAVDVPSGLPVNTGNPPGPAVQADLTVTMGFIKLGTLMPSAKSYVGNQKIASVGYPETLVEKEEGVWSLVDDRIASWLLPERPIEGHKGTFGRLMVVGGSPGMTGAPILSARSGLKSGAGLVFLAGPEVSNQVFEANLVEGLTIPLSTERGWLDTTSPDQLRSAAKDKDAVALGPGLGRKEETGEAVIDFLEKISKPAVLDADGIVAFSGRVGDLEGIDNLVLTPHPGELASLVGSSPGRVDSERYKLVPKLAQDLGITLLLKGVPTVIGSPSGEVSLVNCPNSGLAKGGSGDVLTGLIGGFLAQGLSPFSAARLGAWVHCRAGSLGSELLGVDSLLPRDLIEQISPTLKELRKEKEDNRGGD